MKREIFDIGIGGFPLHLPRSNGRSRRWQAIHQSPLFQTTEDTKPYMGKEAKWVTPESDITLLQEIQTQEGQRPDLITSKKALEKCEETLTDTEVSLEELVGKTGYYNNLKGSNRFENSRVGVIIGSRHLGDDHIQKWAAFMDINVRRNKDANGALTRGNDIEYSHEIGEELLRGMRENETLQAAMRIGRDGNGATVYVHTNALPEWVEREQLELDIVPWKRGTQRGREWVVDAILHHPGLLDSEWTTTELAEIIRERHSEAKEKEWDTLRRQVQENLKKLKRDGIITSWQGGPGNAHHWSNRGLDTAGDFGYIRRPTVA